MSDHPTLAWIKTTDTQEGVQIVWDWEEVEPVGTLTVRRRVQRSGGVLVGVDYAPPLAKMPDGDYLIVPKGDRR